MTDQERVALFRQALEAVDQLQIRFPQDAPLVSIHNQLSYLSDLASGRSVDPRGLDEINIGYITMREVESRDEAAAELLYRVSSEVKEMKKRSNDQGPAPTA